MKRVMVLLFCLLVLSGCDVTYNITLNNDKVLENLTIIETNKELFDIEMDSGWTLRDSFESLTSTDEFSYEDYEVKSLTNSEQLGVEYSSKSASSILNSSILNQCYSNPSVIVEDDVVTIDTGDNFECYDYYDNLGTIEIRFKTNHKIISTNSDSQDGDEYIWHITKDGNKNIKISYYESITYNKYTPFIIGGVIVLVVLLVMVGYFTMKKRNRENSI